MGNPVKSRGAIIKRYIKTWFFVDLLCAIPFDIIVLLTKAGSGFQLTSRDIMLLALLKSPRLLRLGRFFKRIDQTASAHYLRVVWLILGFFLYAHFMCCGFWAVGVSQDDQYRWTNQYTSPDGETLEDSNVAYQYTSVSKHLPSLFTWLLFFFFAHTYWLLYLLGIQILKMRKIVIWNAFPFV